ncbi:MAG TPA: Holliday junction branch migration DNA helicase RuvB [Atribacteraceae bacterium]|nr:Holliday junction branch migration DNA helicase RuvB [Atribacteraceae bacterium]
MTDKLKDEFFRLVQERDEDNSLRPRRLDEFIGQDRTKSNLRVYISASLSRSEPLDHVLLYGPPGLGKTTLASIIAGELGRDARFLSGPTFTRAGDVASILTSLSPHDVLFIDEIHRLPRACEEALYNVMEDFSIDIVVGKGPGAKSIRISLPPFTLVGATTRVSLISAPLRNRFGIIEKIDYYLDAELTRIILRSAEVLSIGIEPAAARTLAVCSRGTPRIANRLLKRARDFAHYYSCSSIDPAMVEKTMACLDIDAKGLTRIDRTLLEILVERYQGGPVGINNLATVLGEDTDTLEEVYEPFLVQLGMIARTPRGRIITPGGIRYLKDQDDGS